MTRRTTRAARRARKVSTRQVSAPPSRARGRGAPLGAATSVAAVSVADKWRRPVAATRARGWHTRRAGPPGARRLSGRNGSGSGGAQRDAVFPGFPLENRRGPAGLARGPDSSRRGRAVHRGVRRAARFPCAAESARPDFESYPRSKGLLLRSCRTPARNLNLVGAARLKSEFWARCAPISSVAARTSAGARVKNEWSPATAPRTEKRTATAVRRAIHQPPPPLTAPSDRGLSPACDVIPFPLSPARAAACASGARPASTHPSRLHTSR